MLGKAKTKTATNTGTKVITADNKKMYEKVMKENKDATKKNIRGIFIWYELLAFLVTFQMIFLLAAFLRFNNTYFATLFAAEAIIVIEEVIRNILLKDASSYSRLRQQLGLIKLWVIPLIVIIFICFFLFVVA